MILCEISFGKQLTRQLKYNNRQTVDWVFVFVFYKSNKKQKTKLTTFNFSRFFFFFFFKFDLNYRAWKQSITEEEIKKYNNKKNKKEYIYSDIFEDLHLKYNW